MSKEIIGNMLKKHWSEKVAEAMDLTAQLFEKNLEDLEILLKTTSNEKIKWIIKLVMNAKIKAM